MAEKAAHRVFGENRKKPARRWGAANWKKAEALMIPPRVNIIICALSFAVLFSAYNTLQNYATSLFPGKLGSI